MAKAQCCPRKYFHDLGFVSKNFFAFGVSQFVQNRHGKENLLNF